MRFIVVLLGMLVMLIIFVVVVATTIRHIAYDPTDDLVYFHSLATDMCFAHFRYDIATLTNVPCTPKVLEAIGR